MSRAPPPALLYLALLTGLFPLFSAGSSSLSSHDAPLSLALNDVTDPHTADLPSIDNLDTTVEDDRILDDATETEEIVTKEDVVIENKDDVRRKRSSDTEWDKTPKSSERVRTGDTILQIGGAVRDAIGDAAAAPGPRASSRLDSFVIRPAAPPRVTPSPAPGEHNEYTTPKPDPREILVEQHSTVRIPCDLNATEVRWYKDNEPMSLPVEGTTVVITRAERGHAGGWRCTTARGKSGEVRRLMIYEAVSSVYLSVDGRRLDANTWVPLRDRAALRVVCHAEGGVPPPLLVWRLRGGVGALRLPPTPTNHSIPGVSVSEVVVSGARQLHGASLVCAASQRAAAADPADPSDPSDPPHAKIDIHVTYPPSFVISRWPGFGVSLVSGRGAALRCDVDANPPARAFWQRDDAHNNGVPLEALGAEVSESAEGAATLRWRELQGRHAGWYRCRAAWNQTHYSSIGYYLNVIELDGEELAEESSSEPPLDTEEPVHQKIDVPLGGNVQLNCPKGSVGCWWRRVVGHNASRWTPAAPNTRAHGALEEIPIHRLQKAEFGLQPQDSPTSFSCIVGAVYEEGGEYRCVGARSADLRDLRDLKRVTLSVTGGATAKVVRSEAYAGGWRLECAVCGREVRAAWLQPGGGGAAAALLPALAPHCWRTVLHVADAGERWCVAASPHGGAVAVFEPRDALPALRALHDAAATLLASKLLLVLCAVLR